MRALALAAAGLLTVGGPAAAATLVVRAEGIEGLTGEVKVAVCNASFDEAGCPLGASRTPTGATEEFVFEGMTPGRYAVAVYHDVNGNGELDTFPPGLPKEPYGFSNDIGRLRPPDFDAALVRVEGETEIVVKVRPLLGF